tara:strand:- start:534 stop:719 length:186 start_codon:yes stop_codon:yes gene_type:complete
MKKRMRKAQFISQVSSVVSTYNASPQGTEDKQIYLTDLTAAVKDYTGISLPQSSAWPCDIE